MYRDWEIIKLQMTEMPEAFMNYFTTYVHHSITALAHPVFNWCTGIANDLGYVYRFVFGKVDAITA